MPSEPTSVISSKLLLLFLLLLLRLLQLGWVWKKPLEALQQFKKLGFQRTVVDGTPQRFLIASIPLLTPSSKSPRLHINLWLYLTFHKSFQRATAAEAAAAALSTSSRLAAELTRSCSVIHRSRETKCWSSWRTCSRTIVLAGAAVHGRNQREQKRSRQ